MGHFTELQTNDGFLRFNAYVAQPEGTPKGGIVVLQEIFGVNAHIRDVADRYAAEGYLVVAPATFDRVRTGVELGYTEEDMATGFDLKKQVEALPAPCVMDDIAAAITHASHAGKVGIVGFCWGGLLSWRSACQFSALSAAVTYYGGGMTLEPDIGRSPLCPVLSHFGTQDQFIPADSIEAFKKAHSDVEVHTYETGHGFNCDQRGAYNEAAATLARERTLAFFKQHLAA